MKASQPVHPRACGERLAGVIGARVGCGSSPRVRGTRPDALRQALDQRFIPARAGNA